MGGLKEAGRRDDGNAVGKALVMLCAAVSYQFPDYPLTIKPRRKRRELEPVRGCGGLL